MSTVQEWDGDPVPHVVSRRPKVLLAANNRQVRRLFGFQFEARDLMIVSANNGDFVQAAIKAKRPQLVVMPMLMPYRSSFLILESLRLTELQFKAVLYGDSVGDRHRLYASMLGAASFERPSWETLLPKLAAEVEGGDV